jgi:hypothetical protein
MSSNILFVFEGKSTEKDIFNKIRAQLTEFSPEVHFVFGGEIYQLYAKLQDDPDLDTFALLKERGVFHSSEIEKYSQKDFAEIYLFFDYDGQSDKADDKSLKELLSTFDNETEKGKLYISYPMVEAFHHINDKDAFRDLCVATNVAKYKQKVNDESLKNLINGCRKDPALMRLILEAHLKKASYLVNNDFSLPDNQIESLSIFKAQLEKHITPHSRVAVLSGLPIFYLNYYGAEKMHEILSRLNPEVKE